MKKFVGNVSCLIISLLSGSVFAAEPVQCEIMISNQSSYQFGEATSEAVYRGKFQMDEANLPMAATVTLDSQNMAWGRINIPLADDKTSGVVLQYIIRADGDCDGDGSSWGFFGDNPPKACNKFTEQTSKVAGYAIEDFSQLGECP